MPVQPRATWRKDSSASQPARWRRKWLLLALLCLAGVGAWLAWGRDPAESTPYVAVEGQVFLDGRPLALRSDLIGKVWFYSDGRLPKSSSTPPSADIDEEGRFTLSTGGKPGVPPGRYWVMLIATQPTDPRRPYYRRRSLIPDRYCALETSGLVFDVKPGTVPGAYDLRLRK